jgi:hypothetical protein
VFEHKWLATLPPSDQPAIPPEIDELTRAAPAAVWQDRRAVFASWPAEQRRLVVLSLHHHICAIGSPSFGFAPDYDELARDVRWERADLLWSLRELAGEWGLDDGGPFWLPVHIALRLPPGELAGLLPTFEMIYRELGQSRIPARERWHIHSRYGILLDRFTDGLPARFLAVGDGFGAATREALGKRLTAPGIADLFDHAATLGKPVPAVAWQRRADELLAAVEQGPATIRAVLERFAEFTGYLRDDTDVLVRGLTGLLARDPSSEATAVLGGVVAVAGSAGRRSLGYPFAPKTAAAAIEILAGRSGDVPIQVLSRLVQTVRNKALNSRAQAALHRAGTARGWAPGEALEVAVRRYGLDDDGRRIFTEDGRTAVIEVIGGKVNMSIMDGEGDFTEARALVKEIAKALSLERARVESLFSQEREWRASDWIARYPEHPVTGVWGRRLIWQATDAEGRTTTGLPSRADGHWTLDGLSTEPVRLAAEMRIRLWHPGLAAPAEVAAWRDHITSTGLRQPFKQAFREIYLITPAERTSRLESHRFTGHILRYRQAAALMGTRGWRAGYLGTWDGGQSSDAVKEFAAGRWRATFRHAIAALDAHSDTEYCVTDQVRFGRLNGRTWEQAPLDEVPQLVFSEAMRDIDLFVGVTSIGTDATWQESGGNRFLEYWRSYVFESLSEVAKVRRDTVARIMPRLKIADRCELLERHLRVRGTRATYRIHLGSANILIEPNDAYLCIVPSGRAPKIQLPFDDDPILSVILSKAILLAADHKITDPSILHQFPAGR